MQKVVAFCGKGYNVIYYYRSWFKRIGTSLFYFLEGDHCGLFVKTPVAIGAVKLGAKEDFFGDADIGEREWEPFKRAVCLV
ncbi:hypothetical protein L2D08_03365 [Domibacillus sp. PGB-M46]|uniref:hypothetical protein n=1 Tax=Domibacillus sp. PGB-M46 TaxID=2910255 RepID=UPI001F56A4EF|nr:hypothetical protein [Domibacillus sp. PGB-M46]MCI2253401.1 hypothetical protein [Domibacillus sp. PGB-M46]